MRLISFCSDVMKSTDTLYTVFLLKIGTKVIIVLEPHLVLKANIQHSSRAHILYQFIDIYTCDDLCRKLEAIFHNSVKGVE